MRQKVSKYQSVKVSEPVLTETALEVVRKRYLRTDMKGKVVETPGEMLWRVARHMAKAEIHWGSNGIVEETAKQFFERMISFKFVCAGKAMFEAGNPGGTGQLSSCFVLPIEDSIQSIFKTLGNAAVVHKNNGGTGFNFSRIRPHGDKVKNVPGAASGPVDFLKAYSAALAQILQGAKRQGANIAIVNADHPDIMDFITLKDQDGTIKNFNVSVGASDAFMEAVVKNDKWELKNPRNGEVWKVVGARELFQMITQHAWATGDPGLAFLDRLQEDNPTPSLGVLDATNPCITGEALVATEHGLEKFEELYRKYYNPGRVGLVTDHRAITGSGVHLHHSQAFYDQGEKEVWELVTKSGFRLKATAEHKIMTSGGWIKLGELNKGSEVLIQSAPGAFSQYKKLPIKWVNKVTGKNGKSYKFNLPDKWSQELGQLLGWLVGDGFVRLNEDEGYVVLAFGARNTKVRELVPVERTRQLSLHSRFVAEWLIKLGVLPVKSDEKRVPRSIFTAPRKAVVGFLQGLFGADGTVGFVPGKSAYVRLTSKSEELLRDVQLLLLNLGIKARIYDRSRKARKNLFPEYVSKKTGEVRRYKSDGLLWELEVSRDSVPIFLDEIGFLFGMHADKIKQLRSKEYYQAKFFDRVVAVRPAGKERVYDLTEPITHSFIANGIVVSNCGEIPLLPYESCNLNSICLHNHLRETGRGYEIDWEDLEQTVKLGVRFLDDMIEVNTYALPEIEQMVKYGNRRIGLGVMGFAHMLYLLEIPYDSVEAVRLAERLSKFIRKKAEEASLELGKERGPFPNFDISVFAGTSERYRNCAVTMIAPTGTISMMANCSSGIEPVFSLVTRRRTFFEDDKANRPTKEFFMVDPIFEEWLEKNIKTESRRKEILEQVAETNSVEGIKEIDEKAKKIFTTTHQIKPEWHVRIQAAWQKWIDNSVSKTVNFPNAATVEDVQKVYMLAWKLGCKGVTIYRDGSKQDQVLNLANGPVHVHVAKPGTGEKGVCPECGGAMLFKEGCATCNGCGYSYCTN